MNNIEVYIYLNGDFSAIELNNKLKELEIISEKDELGIKGRFKNVKIPYSSVEYSLNCKNYKELINNLYKLKKYIKDNDYILEDYVFDSFYINIFFKYIKEYYTLRLNKNLELQYKEDEENIIFSKIIKDINIIKNN